MNLFPRRWIAFAACTVVAVATQLPATAQQIPQMTTNDLECQQHWESSYAAATCGSASENPNGPGWVVQTSYYYVVHASGMNCRIEVDCATNDHPEEQPVANSVLVNLPHFMNLYNCDGTLTHSSC